MTIAAINEQLLRAIGVGVALVDLERLRLRFVNDTFAEWFGGPDLGTALEELVVGLDVAALRAALGDPGRYTTELQFKVRRRMMVLAMDFNLALEGGERIVVVVCQNVTRIKELESMIDSYSLMVERNTRELKREKEQVEKLLLNMMPRSAYEEYKTFGVVTPRLYPEVSVLTLDFVGFTESADTIDPSVIVSELNDIYSSFDRIGEQFGCERIKTIGDIYMTVAGVPDASDDHAVSVANAAVRFLRYLTQRNESHPNVWQARIGCATGPVVGSVVGVQKYIYDVFGPGVARAQRLRWEAARPMSIAADAAFARHLDDRFVLESRGMQNLRGWETEVFDVTEAVRADSVRSA